MPTYRFNPSNANDVLPILNELKASSHYKPIVGELDTTEILTTTQMNKYKLTLESGTVWNRYGYENRLDLLTEIAESNDVDLEGVTDFTNSGPDETPEWEIENLDLEVYQNRHTLREEFGTYL